MLLIIELNNQCARFALWYVTCLMMFHIELIVGSMMQSEAQPPEGASTVRDQFPVTVILERRPAQASRWIDYVWQAAGVAVGGSQDLQDKASIDDVDGVVQLRYHTGLEVRLYVDECDSYYHNLMSPAPKCYIILRQDDAEDEPLPFLVSLSFDEAHAYLEGDDTVFTVNIPAELYRWTEAFVLTHYCPQPLKKRKRKDWKGNGEGAKRR